MTAMRKKYLFDLVGGCIIVLWLIMLGMLVKKVSFNETAGNTSGKVPGGRPDIIDTSRDWMDIFLKGKKVGYSVNQINPLEDGYIIQDEIFLRLNLMGQAMGIYTLTRSVVDREFFLKSFRFRMTSGVVTYQVSGRVRGNRIILEIGEGRAKRRESIKISGPPVMGSGMARFFRGRQVRVGESFRFPVFDPSTMAQTEVVVKVVSREALVISRLKHNALRLEAEMWGQTMTFWIDETGKVLKERGFMGLTLVRSSAANAPIGIEEGGGTDFYELAAVPLKGNLKDADRLTYLKLRMEGLEHGQFNATALTSGRQKLRAGVLEITREKTPGKAGYSIPYTGAPSKLKPFLNPEFNIESDDEVIRKTALDIAGGTRDPITVGRRMMAWVYGNIKKRPVVTVPSAVEVLKTRVGDCNEHSSLLTALLRAVGIPARICVGLVHSKGRFFYHAWTEMYVGEWITMDATLNQMPADVTHIKLLHGGLDRQVEIIGLIGKLRLKVIDYRYD